jgi:hypothetical protein
MNGAPMMSLVRETKLWVGHPPGEEGNSVVSSFGLHDAFGRAEGFSRRIFRARLKAVP